MACFANSTVGQILIGVAIAAAVVAATLLLSPIVGAVLLGQIAFYVGLAATAASVVVATYNNSSNGQSFDDALWAGITEGSTVGSLFSAITNYNLTTMAYEGHSWDERLGTLGKATADYLASRVGAKIGKRLSG